jgi:hypothetical protein
LWVNIDDAVWRPRLDYVALELSLGGMQFAGVALFGLVGLAAPGGWMGLACFCPLG